MALSNSNALGLILGPAISMAGPKINPKAFELDKAMFKLKPQHLVMIVLALLILTTIYVKFW